MQPEVIALFCEECNLCFEMIKDSVPSYEPYTNEKKETLCRADVQCPKCKRHKDIWYNFT